MTINTRAATDEIYDLFNQPLKSSAEDEEEEESDQDYGDETDGDYTSGGESTGTGRLVATSENGDDETSDVKSVSEWSEFTARKHIPHLTSESAEKDSPTSKSIPDENKEVKALLEDTASHTAPSADEVVTPISPHALKTTFVPVPLEDCVVPTHPYRDAAQISQSRLPFMTPIAEKTESSIGTAMAAREEKGYLGVKSPSKPYVSIYAMADKVMSSPFEDKVDDPIPTERMPQPALCRINKTTAPPASNGQTADESHVKETIPKGPIVRDAQCNPVDPATREQILGGLQPPLNTYEGFFDYGKELGRGGEIRRFAKALTKVSKNSGDKTTTNLNAPPTLRFPGTERQYMVKRELGAGAFAPVYLVENVAGEADTEEADEEKPRAVVMGKGKFDHLGRRRLEAVKMEFPPTPWEFYMMRQAKRRLGVSRAAESVIAVYEMHLYRDECYLVEEYRDQGTLLDLVNVARTESTAAAGGVMDEMLVMFFTIELFRTVEALHGRGILHGDLKADNVMVRLDAVDDSEVWAPRYHGDGTGGWSKKGIALIDFGRGIDMRAFRADVQFVADWKTTAQDCAEMRELRPWTFQIDYHGLAGTVHSMLFGKYMDTVAATGGPLGSGATRTYRIRESLKRYWQTELWREAFDVLLNPLTKTAGAGAGAGDRLPAAAAMRSAREAMEAWLEENSEKGVGLQSMLRRLEHAVRSRRR